MAKITYVDHGGAQHVTEVPNGMTVMQGALNNSIHGIQADCGGSCACATCHVYIDPAWRGRMGEVQPFEAAMLECAVERREDSRLSCQIEVTSDLDGLVVHLPESQY